MYCKYIDFLSLYHSIELAIIFIYSRNQITIFISERLLVGDIHYFALFDQFTWRKENKQHEYTDCQQTTLGCKV
jgi:hypothetical protein